MDDCEFLTANAAADALAAGELTSEELVEALLGRIERLDPRLDAFIAVYADEARAAAREADLARRAGQAAGRFHGVPIALKDIIDMEGRVTTGGSKVWESRVSPLTATLARRFMEAGLIVIGKTRTVEFAMGSWGTNRHMGTPWNPWDLAVHRAPGGSSSGSGVSVAARCVPWAIGTDTGGSVRLPSAWNGLTGLKVTFGRVSCHGVLPLAHTLDTPGPMCRSVEDAVDLYLLLQGSDPDDPATWHIAPDDPRPALDQGVAGMRLARMPEHERDGVDREVLAAYDASLDVLSDLGASVVDVELPRRFGPMGDLTGKIIAAEGYAWVGEYIDDDSLPVDDDIRPRIRPGRDHAGARVHRGTARSGPNQARVQCRPGRRRRAAHPRDVHRGAGGRGHRPEHHRGPVHETRQPHRLVCARDSQREDRVRIADLVAGRVPAATRRPGRFASDRRIRTGPTGIRAFRRDSMPELREVPVHRDDVLQLSRCCLILSSSAVRYREVTQCNDRGSKTGRSSRIMTVAPR